MPVQPLSLAATPCTLPHCLSRVPATRTLFLPAKNQHLPLEIISIAMPGFSPYAQILLLLQPFGYELYNVGCSLRCHSGSGKLSREGFKKPMEVYKNSPPPRFHHAPTLHQHRLAQGCPWRHHRIPAQATRSLEWQPLTIVHNNRDIGEYSSQDKIRIA